METKLIALLLLNSLAYTYGLGTCIAEGLLDDGCSIDMTMIPPHPLCSIPACEWGIVPHTYKCATSPLTRSCVMDCFGCNEVRDWESCFTIAENEKLTDCFPKEVSICSKKKGLGYQAFRLECKKPDGTNMTINCTLRCCCESFQSGGVAVANDQLTCATKGVADYRKDKVNNWKKLQNRYCPGYEIADWNKK